MAFFNLTRWPAVCVFVLAGTVAVIFAFVTVNLFSQAMASVAFLQTHGKDAIANGALWQVFELLASGSLALLLWLIFKGCEHVLVDRYLAWAKSRNPRSASARDNSADNG